MFNISFEADIQEAVKELSKYTKLKEPQILGRFTRAIGTQVKKFVSSNVKKTFKNSSGSLKKGITRSGVSKDGVACYVYSKASKNGARYPFMIANDYEINPKNKPFLAFKIGEKWIRTKKVIHKAIAWMPSNSEIDNYMSGGTMEATLYKVLKSEYKKLGINLE